VAKHETEKLMARQVRVTVADKSAQEGKNAPLATRNTAAAADRSADDQATGEQAMESAQTSFPVPATASGMAELAAARKFFTPDDDTPE